MKIDIARLSADGETFEGSDPVAILEWSSRDDIVRPAGDVAYRLTAQLLGDELLVRGRVSARFTGMCARCGGPLDVVIGDPELCVSLPVPNGAEFVDLTSELREAILLSLPTHPVCRADCQMPRRQETKESVSTPSAWAALDQLNLKPKKERRSHGRPKKKEV